MGRLDRTEVQLGADYPDKPLIVGSRSYDRLGRVHFRLDPSTVVPYGTNYNYNTDGTPSCFVRGTETFDVSSIDETNANYPTCFSRSFANNKEIVTRTDADALLSGSPQSGVKNQTTLNAIGRALESRTLASNGSALKDAIFGYDALGRMTSMTRYQDAAHQTGLVTTTWHYDSLGWMTKLEESGVAPQNRTFDSWGEITKVQWCDDLTDGSCPSKDRRTISRFDARGRLTHTEDQTNNSGQPLPGTARDFTYDTGVNNATPPVTATNMLGRLATASWPTGTASFSYDSLGRVNAKVFTDTTVTPNKVYIEQHEVHDDGSENKLHLLLPDTGFNNETVTYDYDTAGRIKSALYNDGDTPPTTQSLFAANGSNAIYDDIGRITGAQYGLTTFNATYAATGRRLLQDVLVTSGTHSREIKFPTAFNGLVTAYDPLNRERQRREFVDGTAGPVLMRNYDALGQFGTAQILQTTTNTITTNRSFAYDALGNLTSQDDTQSGHPGSVGISYGPTDLERICGVAYMTTTAPQSPCNVTYDGVGNILSMPTRPGGTSSGTRSLSYFPGGAVSGITDGGSNASFAYDAFGALQQLTVTGTSADVRADRYFGAFLKQRKEGANSVLTRQIPAPGLTATKHGATGNNWTFAFSDGRGTRFVTDQSGTFVQDTTYAPFGAATSTGPAAAPGSANYTSQQWNGGDLLQAFSIVNLGARLYDPILGRFLSRDPIIGKNPYAFASNDPINSADPTGLEGEHPPTGGDGQLPGTGYCSEHPNDCGNTREYNPGSLDGAGTQIIDGASLRQAGLESLAGSISALGPYKSITIDGYTFDKGDAIKAAKEAGVCLRHDGGFCASGRAISDGLGPLRYIPGPIGTGVGVGTDTKRVQLFRQVWIDDDLISKIPPKNLGRAFDAWDNMTDNGFAQWLKENGYDPSQGPLRLNIDPPHPRDRQQGLYAPNADYIARGLNVYQTRELLRVDTGAKYVGETTFYPWSGSPARTGPGAQYFRNQAQIRTPDPFGGKDIKTDLFPRTSTWFFQNPPGPPGQVNPLLILSE